MKIVILAKNFLTALGAIRSLGVAGYKTDLIYVGTESKGKIAAVSKYVDNVVYFTKKDDAPIIEELLIKYGDNVDKTVLFPTDDYTTMVIDRNRDKLSKLFLMPYVKTKDSYDIVSLMDKSLQEKIAGQCGFQVAKSWIIPLDKDIIIPDDIRYPCFCKPLSSAEGLKAEIGACENKGSLMSKIKKLQDIKRERSILIQEYLYITQEYSIGGAVFGESVIAPCVIEKEIVASHNIGVTLTGRMQSWDVISGMKKSVETFLLETGYQGIFDLEILRCGNKVYFGELNLRSSSFLGAITAGGCNLPVVWVDFLNGEEAEIHQRYSEALSCFQYGKTFLNDKVCWEDYNFGFINRRQLNRYYKLVDFSLIHSDDDPKPEKIFREVMDKEANQHTKNVIKRQMEKLLKKY